MAVYIVTGKLGNGKTLVSVGRIKDKIEAGCMVATNLDLDLVAMLGRNRKNVHVVRVPDKPTADDLYALGNGNPTYDEEKNGLLVLDECGTWFNSRNWQDKSRQAVNDWFLHARKLGWDVLLIVQDINLIDSQARLAIAEHTVFCRRLDRMHVPFFGTLVKILSLGQVTLRLPRIHVGKVVYGISEMDILSDRWVYRGTDLFSCYDTKQAFLSDYQHGLYSMLSPWHVSGRYAVPRDGRFYMRMTKIYWRRFKSPFAGLCGLVAGIAVTASLAFAGRVESPASVQAVPGANVPAVAEKKPAENPDPLPARPSFIAQFADLRIVGFLKGKNDSGEEKVYYQFTRNKRGEPPTSLITSDELRLAGVGVKFLSECRAMLFYQDEQREVFCL